MEKHQASGRLSTLAAGGRGGETDVCKQTQISEPAERGRVEAHEPVCKSAMVRLLPLSTNQRVCCGLISTNELINTYQQLTPGIKPTAAPIQILTFMIHDEKPL